MSVTETGQPAPESTAAPEGLGGVVTELRKVAVQALDAGYPLVAAQIASMADRVEAEAWKPAPTRPRYGEQGR